MVSKQKSLWTWFIWIVIFVPTIIFLYNLYLENITFQFSEIIVFLILAMISAYFPVRINNKPFFFLRTISIATFVLHGLFAEIIVSQVAVLVLMRRLKITKREHYRIPLNLLLFLIASILSAGVYYSVGYFYPSELIFINQNMYQVIAFTLTSLFVNKSTVYLLKRYYFKERATFFNKRLLVSTLSTVYSLASALLMISLYDFLGALGILMVGVHILLTLIMANLYLESKKTNEDLEMINQVTFKLTEHHSEEEIIATYFKMLHEHFNIPRVGLYKIVNQKYIELLHFQQNGEAVSFPPERIMINDRSLFNEIYHSRSIINYQKRKDWKHELPYEFSELGESLVGIPIIENNNVKAILIIYDKKKYAFEKKKIKQLLNLNETFSSLLSRANEYQELRTDSETDYLTGLPNVRHFERFLTEYKNKVKRSMMLTVNCSLIMLDLDYFKNINDTYGHECGNELLKELAQLLKQHFEDKGVVFRYGGEEFLIFLSNYSHNSSVNLAESFRQILEEKEFYCHNYMDPEQSKVKIQVTASLGVASYPEKTDDIDRLVKLADRAMYLGAKRDGRNKVGVYEM